MQTFLTSNFNLNRRSIMLLAPLALVAGVATAQTWPTKPIE